MDSGLAADDQYNLYDKPLFTNRGSNLYRPNKGADTEAHGGEGADEADIRTERFKPTKAWPLSLTSSLCSQQCLAGF